MTKIKRQYMREGEKGHCYKEIRQLFVRKKDVTPRDEVIENV